MLKTCLLCSAAALAAWLTLSSQEHPTSSVAADTLHAHALQVTAHCKPDAPVDLWVESTPLSSRGETRLDYILTPHMDALQLDLEIELPQGGLVTAHSRPAPGAWSRGSRADGRLRLDLPQELAGFSAVLRARITLSDPDAEGGQMTYTTTRHLEWGQVEPEVRSVTRVFTEEEASLDTTATRLP